MTALDDLTLRGTTRPVTFTPNPSGGPARTEDDGELEFLLVLGP